MILAGQQLVLQEIDCAALPHWPLLAVARRVQYLASRVCWLAHLEPALASIVIRMDAFFMRWILPV